MKKLLVILGLLVVIVVAFFSLFIVSEMASPSMDPVVHRGDIVVAARLFRSASLRPGQLVLVDIPGEHGSVRTLREIQEVTADGHFQIAAAAQSGIDSRQFGALAADSIRARVLWVIRR